MKYLLFLLFFPLAFVYAQPHEHLWAGANQYQLWYQPPEQIYEQLDAMQDAGLSVLRIFLGHRPQDYSWEDPPEAYSFEPELGEYNNALLEKVDFLMSECKKRGILLIVALENTNFNGPYEETFGILGQYTEPSALDAFKNRFEYFLNHHNAYLGKAWKDLDEVVLAWEISNEPGIKLDQITHLSREEKTAVLRDWLSEMSTFLKQIDPHTFVSLGITGYDRFYNKGIGDDILDLGNIPDADIYTLHYYGGNLSSWFNKVIEPVRRWGKLLMLQEFGVQRKVGEAETLAMYRSVTQTCYEYGVPWMFWRLGHRKDGGTWSIMSDDVVWQEVIEPQAEKMNRKLTVDEWTVFEKRAAALPVWEGFESEAPRFWGHWAPTTPFADDAVWSELSRDHHSEGEWSLALAFDPDHSTKTSATVFPTRMAPFDWDLIHSLSLDIYNDIPESVTFEIVLRSGAERQTVVLLPASGAAVVPGWNKDLRFDLSAVPHKGWIAELVFRVSGYDKPGTVYFDNLCLNSNPTSGVQDDAMSWDRSKRPVSFVLSAPQPNPFDQSTLVPLYNHHQAGVAEVSIYNVLGQKVVEWQQPVGMQKTAFLRWDGRDARGQRLSSGFYVLRCRMHKSVESQLLYLMNP